DDGADDRQAEAAAAGGLVAGGVDSVEAVENAGQVFRWDAGAVVFDPHAHPAVGGGCGGKVDPPAFGHVSHGVGDEVLDHLLQPSRISFHSIRAGIDLRL